MGDGAPLTTFDPWHLGGESCRHACYHEFIGQITVRADEALVERVRAAARAQQRSINDFVVSVLDAATNPDYVGDKADQIRERLQMAGLLQLPTRRVSRPDPEQVATARAAAGGQSSLSELVSRNRR